VENEVNGEWLGWELEEELAAPVLRLSNYGIMRGFPEAADMFDCRRQLGIELDNLARGEA
jgi:hypothetical protein